MKALVLKDLYNIGANVRSTVLMWLILSFLINNIGAEGYMVMLGVMSGMLVVSTFSYDDYSHWNRYALIMPLERSEIVKAKYVVMVIFAFCGLIMGSVIALASSFILGSFSTDTLMTILVTIPVAFAMTVTISSVSIIFIYKWGVERARMVMIISAFIPTAILVGLYWIAAEVLGIIFTDTMILLLLCISPLLAIAFAWLTCKISIVLFEKEEL